MDDFYSRYGGWEIELETKPDFDEALRRVYAWFEGEMEGRPPIRFSRHNADYELRDWGGREWATLKDRWFDTEYHVDTFIDSLPQRSFLAETFPIFWPNLGPNVFAACYGVPYEFSEVTAWTESALTPKEALALSLDWESEYVKKLDEMTDYAAERCEGKFLIGYTDLHPGIDWAAAATGIDGLLLGLYDDPESVKRLARHTDDDYLRFFERYDAKAKRAGSPSVSWMGIPSFISMNHPSCDVANMFSPEHFRDFVYDGLAYHCEYFEHNIFHMDGKQLARHTDDILTLPHLQGVQWVQGVGDDAPLLQWVPYIKRLQSSGKGVVIDVLPEELPELAERLDPKGLYLCIPSDNEEHERFLIKEVERWALGGK
jgi:hypothetical protein